MLSFQIPSTTPPHASILIFSEGSVGLWSLLNRSYHQSPPISLKIIDLESPTLAQNSISLVKTTKFRVDPLKEVSYDELIT